MTKVIASLMLSTALLPVVVSKADSATTGTKPSTAKTGQSQDSDTTATSNQQNTYVQASETQVDPNTVAGGSSQLREAAVVNEVTKTVVANSAATVTPIVSGVNSATSQGSQAASDAVASQNSQEKTQSVTSQATQKTASSATSDASASSAVAQEPKARFSVPTSQDAQSSSSAVTSQASQASQASQTPASSATSQSSQAPASAATSESSQATSQAKAVAESEQVSVQANSAMGPGHYDDSVMMSAALYGYQDKFFDEIKAGAISGWQKYGVLPSITAAQAILESGWGRSELSTQGNNLFGIKGSYNGQSIWFPTQEWGPNGYYTVNAAFRKYPNWSASVEDHGRFLDENSRYSNLLGERDYQKVARLLQQDGYATDPNYATALINMVNSYGLQSWDQEVANIIPGKDPVPGDTNNNNSNNNNNGNTTDNNSGRYVFKEKTDIHAEADPSSAVVGSYGAGESVYYSAKVEANGYTWLKYQAYSGKTHYVAISGNGNQNNNNNNNNGGQTNVTNESGNFKFTAKTTIRNAASKSAQAVGTYNAGESVHYTGKVTAEGLTWLKYVAYSGATHYVATTGDAVETPNDGNVVATSGSYRFNYDTAIKTAPQTNAQTVGTYRAGETVYYNGKVSAEGQTWLRYQSYSGAVHYVAINDSNNNNQDSKPVVVVPDSGSYQFKATTAIKSAPDNNAQTVGTYYAGNTVYYNGKVTVNGQTWLRYQSYSGAAHYVAIGGNVSSPAPGQNIAAQGSYRFTTTTAIKSAPNASASTVGTYNAGETVHYNGKVVANGQTWLKYQAYSGATHYVAISGTANAGTSSVTNEQGAFRFTAATEIRNAPSMSASVVGRYNSGETVYYNGTVKADGRTWLKYKSYSGATRYVPR